MNNPKGPSPKTEKSIQRKYTLHMSIVEAINTTLRQTV